jgi:DNA-binding transcriptional ArsR family regulator
MRRSPSQAVLFDKDRTELFDGCQTMVPNVTQAEIPESEAEVDIATVLHALSDPVRLQIVGQLAASPELSCGQLEVPVGKSTCSHHLKVLSAAGVVAEREEGVRKYMRLRRADLDRRFPGLLESVLRGVNASP